MFSFSYNFISGSGYLMFTYTIHESIMLVHSYINCVVTSSLNMQSL